MKSLRAATALAATQTNKHGARRAFSAIGRRKAASNLTMPALSPSMTEGNIATWQIKEGDSFSAGDILLEIETDKATMGVEAQDDGILMKIIAEDNTKGLQIGARIAVLAEPGDDISKLELPPDVDRNELDKEAEKGRQQKQSDDQKQPEKPAAETKSSQSSEKAPQEQDKPSDQSAKQSGQSKKQSQLPSVQHLLHENNISDSAAKDIPPSGPHGRLLKGDVLAYLGKIDKKYPSEASARLQKLSHLDLSNIQLAEPKAKTQAVPAAVAEEAVEEPQDIDLALPISLTAVLETQQRVEKLLNTTIPLSVLISRASELANEDLPLPKRKTISSDELFNAVLGLPSTSRTTSRGRFVPQLSTIDLADTTSSSSSQAQPDIIDILSGKTSPRFGSSSRHTQTLPAVEQDLFSVTARPGEEQRAMIYLERLKTVLEKDPGRLVI